MSPTKLHDVSRVCFVLGLRNVLVSAVAITERGAPVLPPFVIMTNWAFMGPLYVALVMVFSAALYYLTRSASGDDISKVTRIQGE